MNDDSLLLGSSINFGDSDAISNIRQSIIDINGEKDEELVETLLNAALDYLEKDLTQEFANELFSLIQICFLRHPTRFLGKLNELLTKSKNNSNYIIATASVLSVLTHVEPSLNITSYSSFVNEALDEILNQIKNSQIESFTVFGKNILPKFKYDLVIDLLLSSKLTHDLLNNFLPFVCSQIIFTKNPKFAKLVHETVKNGFIDLLSSSIILDKDLYARLSTEDLSFFIPKLSDQIFSEIFPEFEKTFCEETELSPAFIINLLGKCDKLNLKLNQIERIFDFLKNSNFTSHVIDQLKKYNLVIPNEFAAHFTNQNDNGNLINVSSDTFVLFKPLTEKTEKTAEFDEMAILSMKKLFDEGKLNEIIEKVVFTNYPPNSENVTFLLNFIKALNQSQLELLYSIDQNRPILLKILEKKIFPPPLLMTVIDIKTVIEFIQNEKPDQIDLLLLYVFAFCREEGNASSFKLDNVTVSPPKNDNLFGFIEKNEIEKLTELDKESLSLAVCSVLFANKKAKNVRGLTKDCILQFFSIALNNMKNMDSIDHLIQSAEIKDTLRDGCTLLANNKSNILNTSIDSILSKINENDILIMSEFPLVIIDSLIEILIKDQYKGNKSNLIKLIFNLTNKQPEKIQIKDGIALIKTIIKYLNFVSNNDVKLNLNVFETEKIRDLFVKIIENKSSSNEEVFNTINLIQNYVANEISFKIDSCEKIIEISDELVKTNNWDKLFVICKFLVNNQFLNEFRQILNNQIPSDTKSRFYMLIPVEEKTTDEFISIILSIPDIETNDSIFEDLFKKLISNESTAIEYLKIIINLIKRKSVSPKYLLQYMLNEYNQYGDTFIKALDCIKVFNPSIDEFIKRIEYRYETFSNPEFVDSLITKLFKIVTEEPDKHQAFFCLKQIASTFPFFFDKDPEKVFKSVLPSFDNYSLVYDDKMNDELSMNKIKSSITAISFITSVMHSTTIIDFFSEWIFKKIEDFSDSQIICFYYVILSILKNSNVKYIFTIFVEKNMNVIEDLLKRDDLPEGPISENYFSLLFEIITNIHNFKNTEVIDCLIEDELKVKSRPFYYYKQYHSTIYYYNISDYEITYKNEIINEYRKNITKKRSFWINYCYSNMDQLNIKEAIVQKFIDHYKKTVLLEDNFEKLPKVSYDGYFKTEKMIRFAVKQDIWIYDYFFETSYSLLPRYQKIVQDVVQKLNVIHKEADNNNYKIDKHYYRLDVNSFIDFYENNISLFKLICDKIFSLKIKNKSKFNLLISTVSLRKHFNRILLENLKKFFNNIQKEDNGCYLTLTSFDICFLPLRSLSNLSDFKPDFNRDIGKKLVDMALQPQYRTNDNFLLELSQLLCIFDKNELDIKVTHIIGFMFLSKNEEIIRKATFLCTKFDDENFDHLGIIQEFFDRQLSLEKYSPYILIDFCNFHPICVRARKTETLNFLKAVFKKYSSNVITKSYKSKLGELIISMMNTISPDRKEYNSFSMSDSSTIEETIGKQKFSFQPIPYFLWDSNPHFWQLFDDNRSIINEIIEEQRAIVSSFKLFTEFPELFDFKLRVKYFRDKMNDRINTNDSNYITVERNDIFESSYKEIENEDMLEEYEKWLNEFDITFDGETGVDAGGLTREWFTKLIRTFFGRDNDCSLFVPTDNENSFRPNTKLNNRKYFYYFRFAGLIIARAIVEGLCIDYHLSLPFIKMILHRNVCFKDMENYSVSMFNSFESILNTDIDNDPYSEYYFEATKVDSDGRETIQLIDGGNDIRVTNENKKEYIKLITDYYLKESIIDQFEEFSCGFDAVIPHQDVRLFTSTEFELVVCGVPKIDIENLKKNFIYEDGYNENTPVVVLFFEAIEKWSQENLAKLLLFFTGASNIPADGQTKEKLIIGDGGERDNFPVAHTCSRKIDLPKYETEEELNEKFMLAINIESFDEV